MKNYRRILKNPNQVEQQATCGTTVRLCTVLSKKTWNFDRRQTQNWKLRCRYQWRFSINKELFQFAGKKKTPDFMPNGIAGTNFGQGLPPVKVKWKKNGRNWSQQFHLAWNPGSFFCLQIEKVLCLLITFIDTCIEVFSFGSVFYESFKFLGQNGAQRYSSTTGSMFF